MLLGSHNSWTYLPVLKWWMNPLAFTAKCQNVNIENQYKLGVRCFDLRIKIDKDGHFYIAHGLIKYKYSLFELLKDLEFLNSKEGIYVRVLYEIRKKREYENLESIELFKLLCSYLEEHFPNINFWCGKNLYNWMEIYRFKTYDLTTDDKYASVDSPKLIDDWWPWIYSFKNNKKILKEGTSKDILFIDFVDYA